MQAIDKRLKKPAAALGADLSLPPDIAQARQDSGGSAQQYGQQRQAADNQVSPAWVAVTWRMQSAVACA